MSEEEYVRCFGRVQAVRPKAVMFIDPVSDAGGWVPRSLIHGADDSKLDKISVGEELHLRIMRWKALDLDLG